MCDQGMVARLIGMLFACCAPLTVNTLNTDLLNKKHEKEINSIDYRIQQEIYPEACDLFNSS